MLLEYLKQATADEHRRLEERLDWLSPSFTLDDYADALARFYGFLKPWEALVAPKFAGTARAIFDARRKTPLLERDWAALGEPCERLPLAEPAELPPIAGLPQAWGSWYVVEGSTLGGQILTRHFHERFGLSPDSGAAYFSGYGEATPGRWREFREAAERAVAVEDYPAAGRAAIATFQCLAARLTAPRPAAAKSADS